MRDRYAKRYTKRNSTLFKDDEKHITDERLKSKISNVELFLFIFFVLSH
jgi:hypothetical protein